MSEELRLQVFLSRSGVASRRASADLIRDGRVQVNGKVVTEPGLKVNADDTVRLDGESVTLEEEQIYLMLNKPLKVICSADDPEGRVSVTDIVGASYAQRLFTVGRLDYMTSGLILLTNDGEFANRISHPRSGIIRKYRVETREQIPRDMLEKWKGGTRIRGVLYRLEDFFYESTKVVVLSLREGKNREIRNVFAASDLNVKTLHRIQFGALNLGNLKSGKYRELSKGEIRELIEHAGKNTARPRMKPRRTQRTGPDETAPRRDGGKQSRGGQNRKPRGDSPGGEGQKTAGRKRPRDNGKRREGR